MPVCGVLLDPGVFPDDITPCGVLDEDPLLVVLDVEDLMLGVFEEKEKLSFSLPEIPVLYLARFAGRLLLPLL